MTPPLRVGNCSGFYGDRLSAARELVDGADLDVLTGDWLAELTMLILARQRRRNPLAGWAPTFVTQLEHVLGTCVDRGIRIVSNAGGVNPAGCAQAITELAERLGLSVSVGHVVGDDLLDAAPALAAEQVLRALDDGAPLHLRGREPLTASVYLGGWPIASCLERGAQVVVTGRVTDAALAVGAATWAHGWRRDDWDRLAGAVVAGHLLECGAQVTGGNYPFFADVPGIERLGFPLAEVLADGSSVITKAPGSGGMVTVGTVTAQLLYEIGAPDYVNPDVTAHFDTVRLEQEGPDRVRVSGVLGAPPPPDLKVSLAVEGGYRNAMTFALTGLEIERKAKVAERCVRELLGDVVDSYDELRVELLGRPDADPVTPGAATAFLRIAVRGSDEAAVGRRFSSAVVESGLSSYPGLYLTSPPAAATPYATYLPALVPADQVTAYAEVQGDVVAVPSTATLSGWSRTAPVRPATCAAPPASWLTGLTLRSPLGAVAGARSGDKGGHANVGVWVEDDDAYAWLVQALTPELLARLVPETDPRHIDRYELPNVRALNFVLRHYLGDGVASCLRLDAQAKGLGEYLRACELDVPVRLLDRGREER